MRIFSLTLLVLASAGGSGVAAEETPAAPLPEIVAGPVARRMDDLLRRAAALGFGGQVVVERDGELILARAYGQADRRAGRPFAIDTPVGIASISKHLTALAVLRLVDRGRVRLSDPIERHLDSVPPDKLGITIEQLLTHTSGLPGGDAAGDFELDSRAELLERILALDRAAASGERWIYSNSGYSLLAAIVEEAAGIPYEQFVDEQLFAAAGMRHSGFWHRPPPDGLPAAHPYIGWRDQGSPADWPRNWRVFGAGDVLSTAADLYRLDRALRRGELVSRRLWRAARSVQAEIDETTGYGYGLFVYTDAAGRTVLEHGGDWQRGYNGLFMRYVDEEIVIVVTSNARDHQGNWLRQAVQRELEGLARGAPPELLLPEARPIDGARRARLAGTYWLDDGSRFVLAADDDALWIAALGQSAADALDGRPGPAAEPALTANGKTRRLLAALIRDEPGYAEALGDEGALGDYVTEWKGLTDARGALVDFEIFGSAAEGSRVTTSAGLRFSDGSLVYARYFWSEAGRGRLVGTFVRPPWFPPGVPLALPVVETADGPIAYDLYEARGVALSSRERDGAIEAIVLGGVTARRAHAIDPRRDGAGDE